MNDIVTHAWQTDELRSIPDLYGARTAPFRGLIERIASGVEPLHYRQVPGEVVTFSGRLDDHRLFPAEFIHQHLQAYLDELHIAPAVNAVKFFI